MIQRNIRFLSGLKKEISLFAVYDLSEAINLVTKFERELLELSESTFEKGSKEKQELIVEGVVVDESSFEVEVKDEQICLKQSGSTIQVVGENAKIDAQPVESTIKGIAFEDLGVKPLIFGDQSCGMLSIGFVDLSAKEARRRQWRIAWVFLTFRWTIALVPLWIWEVLQRDLSVGVYYFHKTNRGLFHVDFLKLPSFYIGASYYWFISECIYQTRG